MVCVTLSYRVPPCGRRCDFVSRKERLNAVLDPTIRLRTVDRVFTAVVVCFLEEDEDNENGEGRQCHRPPVLNWPIGIGCHEASKSRTSRGTKIQSQMQNGESSTSLMQEEHVHKVSRAKNADRDAKEGREVPRDEIRCILIMSCHERCPYLSSELSEQSPKDDRRSSEFVGKGPPEISTGSQSS
jgi:NAD-dependent dihydropyrimidine dehydrogenase PreA subunit